MGEAEFNDRRMFIGAGLVTLLFFSLVAFTQWVTFSEWGGSAASSVSEAVLAILGAFVPSAIGIALFAAWRGYAWSMGWRAAALVVLALFASSGRLLVFRLVWPGDFMELRAVEELINGIVPPLLAVVVGLYYVDAQGRTRRIERLVAVREFEARKALADLEHEELRVRREVSDSLHGQIQQRLVFIATRLAAVVPLAEAARDVTATEELRRLISEIDDLREEEVRRLSHALYPSGVDIGLHQALQLQVRRVPANIAVRYSVTDAAAAVDDVTDPELDPAARLLLVGTLEEGITNAIKHGMASELSIAVDLAPAEPRPRIVIEVADNGRAAPPGEQVVFSGLARLRSRLESHGGGLELLATGERGATLRFWIERPAQPHRPAG
ncbi:MAG: hypothetical protein LBT54_01905 [Bifidobacteriaceae bacterium]|jgi:signal transduction histidine kinase|nr:hypothetical protein [Bifidobacteriaceae bacterium]